MSEPDSRSFRTLRNACVSIVCQRGHSLTRSNGFFIRKHSRHYLIVCPYATVMSGGKILVTVPNVNNQDETYSYDAEIVGIDGAANLAFLRLPPKSDWNVLNPEITDKHPYFSPGKSLNLTPGESVTILGQLYEHSDLPGVLPGYVTNNRHVVSNQNVPGEFLALSHQTGMDGHPVVNRLGQLVGMTVKVPNSPLTLALSEYFMRRQIKSITETYEDGHPSSQYREYLDVNGLHIRYVKSWLGFHCLLMSAQDYNSVVDNEERSFSELSNGPPDKPIVGYRIIGRNNKGVQCSIQIGDIITHIDDCPLGGRRGQVSPHLLLWKIAPKTEITLSYRVESEQFYHTRKTRVTTLPYPEKLDQPQYEREYIVL